MKILAISCSPRKEGNTEILLNRALEGAQKEGADTELFSVINKSIAPCNACMTCITNRECVINDDMSDLYDKMLEADGIIFGTPVYFYNMTAQCKAIVDRTIALNHPEKNLANKVGGIVVVGGSLGNIDVIKDLYFFFAVKRMLSSNFISAYAAEKGDVNKLEKCIEATENLGRLMVRLTQLDFQYPLELMGPAIGYGTHTK
jgi:multimeric flavodoxin WrbA